MRSGPPPGGRARDTFPAQYRAGRRALWLGCAGEESLHSCAYIFTHVHTHARAHTRAHVNEKDAYVIKSNVENNGLTRVTSIWTDTNRRAAPTGTSTRASPARHRALGGALGGARRTHVRTPITMAPSSLASGAVLTRVIVMHSVTAPGDANKGFASCLSHMSVK